MTKKTTTKSTTGIIKQVPEHRDKLGIKINVGDHVAYPDSNHMDLGCVKKLNPKMINIARIGNSRYPGSTVNKYPDDCVVVDGAKVTMYLIKKSR